MQRGVSAGPEVWVVSGGIATGKSRACAVLGHELPGAVLFDADERVRWLLGTERVGAVLRAAFGDGVFVGGGAVVDRAALREAIVADAGKRAELEGILHPLVRDEFAALMERSAAAGTRLVVAEVPLFFEGAESYPADRVVVVAVSEASQRRRLEQRGGWSPAAIDGVLAAQWPIMAKVARADVVWWNEGPAVVLERQVRRTCAGWRQQRG